MAAWISSLENCGRAEARLLLRVFRRSRKAPFSTFWKSASSRTATAGCCRRTQRSTVEVTLGWGRKHSGSTSKSSSVSIRYWSCSGKAPISGLPWGAVKRWAASFWMSTVSAVRLGMPASFVSTGVVML